MTGLTKGAAALKVTTLRQLGRGRAMDAYPSVHPFQGSLPHLSYFFLPLRSDIAKVI